VLKKYAIIALLISAYTIVLGHSIIPHHHHDDDHATKQSSHHQDEHHDHDDHHDHEDDQDDADAGLSHDFENYIHTGSTGDLHQQPNFKLSGNTITTAYIIAIFDFQIRPVESPPPIVRHFNDHIPHLRHSFSPKALRAPPCSLA
jgi:hypothetical protein